MHPYVKLIPSCRYANSDHSFRVIVNSVVDVDDDVTRRDLVLLNNNSQQQRAITHYHYHAWPDHGVPSSTASLRNLISLTQEEVAGQSGPQQRAHPPIVHCR